MALPADFGMTKDGLKALLTKANGGEVNCAIAKGKNIYILVDATKQPDALGKALLAKYKDAKDVRHGTIKGDPEKGLVFTFNKAPASGQDNLLGKLLTDVGHAKYTIAGDEPPAKEGAADAKPGPETGTDAKGGTTDAKTGPAAYGKARLAWVGVRGMIQSNTDKLGDELAKYYEMPELAGEIKAAVKERVAPVLQNLDESLSDALDAAMTATDPAVRAKRVDEAKAAIGRYAKFIATDSTLSELDANPVVPMKLRATLGATLKALSAAVS